MFIDFDIVNEASYVWLKVHDPKTNTNWLAELYGTPEEIRHLGLKSAKFMDDAGFVVGWRQGAEYRGSIDYLILVREAVERCWWASFKMKWRQFFEMAQCPSFKTARRLRILSNYRWMRQPGIWQAGCRSSRPFQLLALIRPKMAYDGADAENSAAITR